jgi:hypothetical protein
MRGRIRRGFAAAATMAIAVSLLAISLAGPVVSTTADFSIFNSGWNGTSKLAVLTYQTGKFSPTFTLETSGTDIQIAQVSLTDLDLVPETDAVVIIGPTKTFTATEGTIVGEFVRGGGNLLLADDFGTGNSLLASMGATSRFTNLLAMDLAFEKQPEFSVCFDFAPDPLTANVTTILLNYPSSLSVNSSTTQTIARTSVASWLDTNGDRRRELGEPNGPLPVLARERLGLGDIILLSDPSVLINGMSKNLNNSIFSTNLLDAVSAGRSSVYFDESHRTFFDPVTVTMQFTGSFPTSAIAGLAALAFILVLWISTDLVNRSITWTVRKVRVLIGTVLSVMVPSFWKRREKPAPEPLTLDEMAERAIKEHPEWRTGLVRYVLRERERHRKLFQKSASGDNQPDAP